MLAGSLKSVAAIGAILMVGFNPAVHIFKHFDPTTTRYRVWDTMAAVRPEIKDGTILFLTNDRFLPPFLDYVYDYYAGSRKVEAHWVLPYIIGGRSLEDRTIADFVCFAAKHHGREIIWALDKGNVLSRDDKDRTASIELGNWRRIEVKFAFDDILHEFSDGIFLRGQIRSIHEIRDGNGRTVNRALLTSGTPNPGCSDR